MEKKKRIQWSRDLFVEQSKAAHGLDAYDYSEVVWINVNTKVTLICRKHEEPIRFHPLPLDHVRKGSRCPSCAAMTRGDRLSLTKGGSTQSFIEDSIAIHADRYDYSLVDYHRTDIPVIVICRTHGSFEITKNSHVNQKSGCPRCARELVGLKLRKDNEDFLLEALLKHGGAYEYPDPYVGAHIPLKIVCRKHGEFMLKPYVHINGQGCYECGIEDGKVGYPYTVESFIKKAISIHGPKFDYSHVKLTRSFDEIEIGCSKHGIFTQVASQHIWGYGCYKCARMVSGAEMELADRIRNLGLDIICNTRQNLGFEVDIFIPSMNIAIEYNGLLWHSEWKKTVEVAKTYQLRKTEGCEKQGIRLIHVWEDDWIYRNETCWTWIKAQLGFFNQTLNARDCTVQKSNWAEVEKFVSNTHIQGVAAAPKYTYCLKDEGGCIVGAMLLSTDARQDSNTVVLKRFCTIGNVRGGFSKLLKAFLREHGSEYTKLISFSDRSWSQGLVYSRNGFTQVGIGPPRYYWTKNRRKFHSQAFEHKNLANKLKVYDPNLSTAENCRLNGYLKVWDSGLIKWEIALK